MQKYRSSKRGLTFSIDPEEKYYPGSHYIYEVRKNCIIIRPSDNGMTVSRKKSGNNIRALFDIRRKEVRNAVAHCSYLEMEIKKDRIVIRCIQETRNKIVSMEEVLKEFSISNTVLKLASGLEGQISLAEYFGTIGGFETYEQLPAARKKDIKKVFTVMSLFSGAGMLDWPFYKDNCFKLDFACDYDKGACESYRENIGDHILCGDVRNVSGYKDPYNLIIGGPSCKPFSSSNRRKRLAEHEDVDLVNEYIRITKENKPEIFVIENVPQFLTCQDDGIFKLAGLIKLMAEDVSKEDSWWKCEYIGPAIGLRETKNFWDEISVTDDSGYRSITLGDTKGQHIKGVHRYMLLYSENYNYADEKWKYPCFPSVEEIAERLQLVLEKVPLIPLELNNCDSEEFWYENRDEDSLQYFSDVVREYADKIAADPRTEEEIFSDIE